MYTFIHCLDSKPYQCPSLEESVKVVQKLRFRNKWFRKSVVQKISGSENQWFRKSAVQKLMVQKFVTFEFNGAENQCAARGRTLLQLPPRSLPHRPAARSFPRFPQTRGFHDSHTIAMQVLVNPP